MAHHCLILLALLAVFGAAIAPADPNAQDLMALLEPPSAAHWLGTDEIGRDILSRVIVGTRVTLAIAGFSTLLAGIAGIALGLIAGYAGGALDRGIMLLLDLLMTIPTIVLAIAIVAAVGANEVGLITAITVSFVPSLGRLVRARVLELRELDYIEAARAIGMRHGRILLRHMLPNAVSVIVIELSLMAGPGGAGGIGAWLSRTWCAAAGTGMGRDVGRQPRISAGRTACRLGAGVGGHRAGACLQPVRGRPA